VLSQTDRDGASSAKKVRFLLKRELRDVVKLAGEIGSAIQNEQNKVQALARELAELTKLLATLEEERREAEKQP